MSLTQILILIGLSISPVVELRGSIPYGILSTDIPPILVFLISVVANWLLAPATWLLLSFGLRNAVRRWNWLSKFYDRYQNRVQKELHQAVDKYGTWGLAVFIAIPLPGTGVVSGTVAAFALGMHFRNALLASVVGVIGAGIIVTVIALSVKLGLSGAQAFSFFLA